MITNNNPLSTTSLQDDENLNLKALSDTLYELTKYDNDLRVFFETCITCNSIIKSDRENLEEVFNTKLGHNENNFKNDIKNGFGMSKGPETKLGSEPNYNENDFQNNTEGGFKMPNGPKTKLDSKLGHNENNLLKEMRIGALLSLYASRFAPDYNNSQIGNQKLNHSTETKLTADLIYEFLQNNQIKSSISNTANGAEQFLPTPKNNSIQLDISKLSNKLQQIVNCLLGIEAPHQPDTLDELLSLLLNNNNKSNTNGQNQHDQFSQLDFDFTNKDSSNELQNSNSQQKSDNKQVSTEEQSTKELVFLTTDQFKDLIYYLIVLAVAQNEEINIYATENNVDYDDVKKGIEEDFKSKNINGIFTKLDDYRQKVENQILKKHIFEKLQEQEDQTSFWFPLLLSYLGRASFLYGLYNAIISEDNRKKNVIDVALASPNILFALSLLFGFGAAANLVLGFITLVSLLYKFIDQYPKERKKCLIYKLVRSELFRSKSEELGNALTPRVGNFYKRYKTLVNEDNKKQLKEQVEYVKIMNKKYKNVLLPNQNGHQNNLQNPYIQYPYIQ